MIRLDRKRELLLLEAESLQLRADLARVKLLPLEAQRLQLLRIREQQAAPPLPAQLPPQPELLLPVKQAPQVYFPMEEELLEQMLPAEQQLGSLLAGPLTPPASTPPSPT